MRWNAWEHSTQSGIDHAKESTKKPPHEERSLESRRLVHRDGCYVVQAKKCLCGVTERDVENALRLGSGEDRDGDCLGGFAGEERERAACRSVIGIGVGRAIARGVLDRGRSRWIAVTLYDHIGNAALAGVVVESIEDKGSTTADRHGVFINDGDGCWSLEAKNRTARRTGECDLEILVPVDRWSVDERECEVLGGFSCREIQLTGGRLVVFSRFRSEVARSVEHRSSSARGTVATYRDGHVTRTFREAVGRSREIEGIRRSCGGRR